MKSFLPTLKKSKISSLTTVMRAFCFFLVALFLPLIGYTQLSINKIAIKDSNSQPISSSNPLLAGEDFWYVITFSINTQVNAQLTISDIFSPNSDIEPVDANPATAIIEPIIALSNSLITTNYTNPTSPTYINPYNQNNRLDFTFF